jgi:hypothetical protein
MQKNVGSGPLEGSAEGSGALTINVKKY